jgi:D-cysteine desulfhydrase
MMKAPGRISLANIPTPISSYSYNGCKFLMKRDDLTGFELSGNKVRKLEYIMAQAVKERSTIIYTCGGEQSNHSRATVAAARSLGLKVKLFLWGRNTNNAEGNLFIDKFLGAEINYLTRTRYDNVNELMADASKKDEKKKEKVFIIPEGGSSSLGIWGYINFIYELSGQLDIKKLKGILSACGSGGTTAGLLVGAALAGIKLKVYAVNVLYEKSVMKERILSLANKCIKEYRLGCEIDESSLVILDGYSSEGYKKIDKKKLEVIRSFSQSSGIMLDPAYTGKAFCAYNDLFLEDKRSTGILFVHTGGFFGIFSKRKEYLYRV